MKPALLTALASQAFSLLSLAGGLSTDVLASKVKLISIEKDRITIIADAVITKRVLSTKEKGDGSVFGQPAQWQVSKVSDCKFEIVPYSSRADVAGVPGPAFGKVPPDIQAMYDKQWAVVTRAARGINAGDSIRIGYQEDRATITGFAITHIIGAGSLSRTEL